MNQNIQIEEAAILPAGFKSSGICAGIKKDSGKKDMALFFSDTPASVAGTFTQNQVKAAPVKLCQAKLKNGSARAIIMNSGNANACTGAQGMANAKETVDATAKALGVSEDDVFVCSTGHIGMQLPIAIILEGVEKAVAALSSDKGLETAEAMMTTDTVPKYCTTTLQVDGRPVRITGFAKGAGMIEPNMATMLCYITTDAAVDATSLQSALTAAVDESFNRISVDGDTSTNDTVLCLANGHAGNAPLSPEHDAWTSFTEALDAVVLDLAMKIVEDGEGATKLITIHVKGAKSFADADTAARSVANSLLLKTSWVGDHPHWGRIMDAIGYSAATVVEEKVGIAYDDKAAVRGGLATDTPFDDLKAVVSQPRFSIHIDLGLGSGEAIIYTCDCTEEYVRINM